MFILKPRKSVPLSLTLLVPVVAIALTLLMGGLIFGFWVIILLKLYMNFLLLHSLAQTRLATCWLRPVHLSLLVRGWCFATVQMSGISVLKASWF